MRIAWLTVVTALTLSAQGIDVSFLDKLAEKAKASAVVNLGPEQLALLTGGKPPEGKAGLEELLKKLKGVHVWNYEFDAPGLYNMDQVRAFRDRIKADGNWVALVTVREKDEFTDILVKRGADGKPAGLLIVAAEPKELSVVHIEGSLDLTDLSKLGGIPGVPAISSQPAKKTGAPKSGKP